MWWLLYIITFIRDYERDWGTPEARRKNAQGCLGVLALATFVALMVFVIVAANAGK